MTEKEDILYQKVAEEQELFKNWLVGQPTEEILDHAYEYAMRNDIVMQLESMTLTEEQIDALLSLKGPLENLYKSYGKIETDHMEIIGYCIEQVADNIIREQKEMRELPVYRESAEYAIHHGEGDVYKQSFQANIRCKEAMEEAIAKHYHENRLEPDVVRSVIETFGLERVMYVTANTIQKLWQDGRISQKTKAWARTIPVIHERDQWGQDRCVAFYANRIHPGVFNLFAEAVQQEQKRQQRAAKRKRKRQEEIQL